MTSDSIQTKDTDNEQCPYRQHSSECFQWHLAKYMPNNSNQDSRVSDSIQRDELRKQIEEKMSEYSIHPQETHEDKCGFWGTEDGEGKEFCDCSHSFDVRQFDRFMPELLQLIQRKQTEARIESLRWALSDYNMPDTDTQKNIEQFINDLTNQLENGGKR